MNALHSPDTRASAHVELDDIPDLAGCEALADAFEHDPASIRKELVHPLMHWVAARDRERTTRATLLLEMAKAGS